MTPNSELESLLELIGEVCHENYVGCSLSTRPEKKWEYKEWDYSYSAEVINMLRDPRIAKAVQAYAQSKSKADDGYCRRCRRSRSDEV